MYSVKIYNGPEDEKGVLIHSHRVNPLKLEKGIIKKAINEIDTFSISFYQNNPAFNKMNPFKTLVKVFNHKRKKYIFEGRVLSPNDDMDSNGFFSSSYICEGELGYLHDAQQRHLEFRGSVREALETMIVYYNSQVEEYKQFTVGIVEVEDPNDFLYFYLSAEKDTFESIKEKLLDKLGGELRIRKENGIRYLDYLNETGEEKGTEIKLSKNLVSMSRSADTNDIITRLTPLGTRIESEDETATDASEARLTIESVNSGLPYIDRQDLFAEFGIQGGSQTWENVNEPSNLIRNGRNWLNNQKIVFYQYKIEAIDLSQIGLAIDDFEIGNTHYVDNPIMGINEKLRIVGTSTDINEPENSDIVIGDKFKGLFEYQSDMQKREQSVIELESIVSSQRKILGTVKNELKEVANNYNLVSEDIIELTNSFNSADVPGMQQALLDIKQSQIDLGNAIKAIPVHLPASSTEDGLLTSALYTKLVSIQIATQAIDGLMTATDKVALDKVIEDVGNKSLLKTSEKLNIVLAINELNDRLKDLEI